MWRSRPAGPDPQLPSVDDVKNGVARMWAASEVVAGRKLVASEAPVW
jgi:hypothetical protein